MTNKRISLNENDFKTLVSGGVVEQDGVKIILDKDLKANKIVEIAIDTIYQNIYNEGHRAGVEISTKGVDIATKKIKKMNESIIESIGR